MRKITYAQALNEALREEMQRDERVFILGEDVGLYGGLFTVTKGLMQEFGPERVRDTPVSEAAIIGAAVGAALTGKRPVAEIMYIDFITCGMDQLVNQAAKIIYTSCGQVKLPLVIRTQAGTGRRNGPQHSQSLEAWFMHTPGIKVVMPSTPYDAKGLLKAAIRDDNPVLFIEHKILYSRIAEVPEEEYVVPLGKADVKRVGKDVTLVALSWMVEAALSAAEKLASEGIETEVIDPRSLVPLDMQTILDSVKKTNRVVIVHEAVRSGGAAAEVGMRIMEEAFDYLDAPIQRVTGLDIPVPYSKPLEDAAVPNESDIIKAVKSII